MERHAFQAEIQQLLDIVIHSLYTDREIFVRELISNAADACERLRFVQSSGTEGIQQAEVPLGIQLATDDKEKRLTVTDTGVGMTQAELVENLGTVAHSGTRAFVRQLAEAAKPDLKLIGQFGVGFYSAFMVARQVTVLTRSWRPDDTGWRWTSDGAGGYTLEPAGDLPRGTQVLLDLKEDAAEFAQAATVERLIQRYSNFVQFPIELNGKRVNTIQAIWARSKNEIKDEEYSEFYRYIGHDQEPPRFRLHFTADAPISIQALLFVPARSLEILGLGKVESQVNLHCCKVLIEPHAKGLFPEWLRFLQGVVDSEDLPLNVSRERMQDSGLMRRLNRVLTGRFVKFLREQSEKDAAAYDAFYADYQRFLKEGALHDDDHRADLGALLRFESSALPKGQHTSLADVVKRIPAEQKELYFQLATQRDAAENSPYCEVLRARRFEVLYCYDPADEFVLERLHEFDGKPLKAAEKADVTAPAVEGTDALNPEAAAELAKWVKETLGTQIEEVRLSQRLVDSPALVVARDRFLTAGMHRLLRSLGRTEEAPAVLAQDLELNPRHPITARLDAMRRTDPALASQVAAQMLDNARIAAGLLEDPRTMLGRLNGLLEQLLERGASPTPGPDQEPKNAA